MPETDDASVRVASPVGRIDPYLLFSAAVVLWAAAVVATGTWVGDFQLHVATVRVFAEDFLRPVDPMLGVGEGGPYFSPYILVIAAVVRLTGAGPATVLGQFGVVNVVVLLIAFRRFVRAFSPSAGAAAVALLALLLLWGPGSPGWSGFLDLRSLAETLPYPSTIAFALMLFLWERLLSLRANPGAGTLVAIGALAAAIVLVHPFTAVGTAIGAVAILARGLPPRWWLWLAGTGVAVVAAVALWPYSSVADLFSGASALVAVHQPLRTALLDERSLFCLYGLVALPALALRLRRDRLDPLVLMFVLAGGVVFAALVTRQHHLLRMVPVMMLPLQVAFGIFVVERGPSWARLATAGAAALLVLGGLAVNTAPVLGAASAVPVAWLPERFARPLRTVPVGADPTDRVRDHAPPGATVLTDSRWSDRRLNLLGYFAVNPGWPNPWRGDEAARAGDRRRLLDGATSARERGEIARRYDASCVLTTNTPAVAAIDGYPRVDAALFCR